VSDVPPEWSTLQQLRWWKKLGLITILVVLWVIFMIITYAGGSIS
jgi:hypothetical protein